MHLRLLGALFAITTLTGCATTAGDFTNVFGQTWTYTEVKHIRPRMTINSDAMLEEARRFCHQKGLLMQPGDMVRETLTSGTEEKLELTFRCRQATGYKTPYNGFWLHFSGDEEDSKKK